SAMRRAPSGGQILAGLEEVEPLSVTRAAVPHHGELLGVLDTLGDHHSLHGPRHRAERPQQVLLDTVPVDVSNQRAVELDEIRLHLRDALEAGRGPAYVVDGDPEAARAQIRELPAEVAVVA